MIRFFRLLNCCYLSRTGLISSIVGLLLFTSSFAQADSNLSDNRSFLKEETIESEIRYTPPTQPSSPQGPTTSTGRRGGCSGNTVTELTALAPQSYVGQTISPYPTVAWFVPDTQSFPIEVFLYEYYSGGRRLIAESELQSSHGIMSWSIPTDQHELKVGQRYLWRVVLLCNPASPSSAIVIESEIEVVEPSDNLEMELAETDDPIAMSSLYASAGLWYDAFREVMFVQGEAATSIRLRLLRDLASLEADNSYEHQVRLDQIVEFEDDSL